ncbi:hypothetical protein HAX54_019492 [Datura stramonium]|uniref:RNase H type-1 domain-containing protein n=1 Tax=Datura stramonium TaxID=4076 RepID=A0ABS8S1T1_DATST|nr:hypothetical protein [Datura stramonium]
MDSFQAQDQQELASRLAIVAATWLKPGLLSLAFNGVYVMVSPTYIIMEADSLSIISMLNGISKSTWHMMEVILKTQNYINMANIRIQHCFREANQETAVLYTPFAVGSCGGGELDELYELWNCYSIRGNFRVSNWKFLCNSILVDSFGVQ